MVRSEGRGEKKKGEEKNKEEEEKAEEEEGDYEGVMQYEGLGDSSSHTVLSTPFFFVHLVFVSHLFVFVECFCWCLWKRIRDAFCRLSYVRVPLIVEVFHRCDFICFSGRSCSADFRTNHGGDSTGCQNPFVTHSGADCCRSSAHRRLRHCCLSSWIQACSLHLQTDMQKLPEEKYDYGMFYAQSDKCLHWGSFLSRLA